MWNVLARQKYLKTLLKLVFTSSIRAEICLRSITLISEWRCLRLLHLSRVGWDLCVVTGKTSGGNPLLIKSSLQIFMSSLLSLVRAKLAAILRLDHCQVPGLYLWYIFDVMQLAGAGNTSDNTGAYLGKLQTQPISYRVFPSLYSAFDFQNHHYFSYKLLHSHYQDYVMFRQFAIDDMSPGDHTPSDN